MFQLNAFKGTPIILTVVILDFSTVSSTPIIFISEHLPPPPRPPAPPARGLRIPTYEKNSIVILTF